MVKRYHHKKYRFVNAAPSVRRCLTERFRRASVKNFVVRIYREDKGKQRRLLGVVEKVGQSGRQAFTNPQELWDILNSGAGKDVFAEERTGIRKKRDKIR